MARRRRSGQMSEEEKLRQCRQQAWSEYLNTEERVKGARAKVRQLQKNYDKAMANILKAIRDKMETDSLDVDLGLMKEEYEVAEYKYERLKKERDELWMEYRKVCEKYNRVYNRSN